MWTRADRFGAKQMTFSTPLRTRCTRNPRFFWVTPSLLTLCRRLFNPYTHLRHSLPVGQKRNAGIGESDLLLNRTLELKLLAAVAGNFSGPKGSSHSKILWLQHRRWNWSDTLARCLKRGVTRFIMFSRLAAMTSWKGQNTLAAFAVSLAFAQQLLHCQEIGS